MKNPIIKIMNYAGKTIKKSLMITGLSTILCLSYLNLLAGVNEISVLNQKKINSVSQLEQLAKIERKKINSKNKSKIIYKLTSEDEGYSEKSSEDKYKIVLGGKYANESMLKHELYHILDGHFKDTERLNSGLQTELKYLFWYEPQAVIYATTGLKF